MCTFRINGFADCVKNVYANLRRYTWYARGKFSRLDYWFIYKNVLNQLEMYKILPELYSHYSILKIGLRNQFYNRGKRFLKFNTSLFYDTKYVEKVKKKSMQ